jgi:hypothetical protein
MIRRYLRPPSVILVALACLAIPDNAASQADDVQSVIAQVLEAYGGARLAEVGALRLEGDIYAFPRREDGRFIRIVEGPGRLKTLLHYPSNTEARILRDERGWRGPTPGTVVEVSGPMLQAMTLQSARAGIPWIVAGLRSVLRITAQSENTVVLTAELSEQLLLRFFIDTRSHQVRRSESDVRMGSRTIPFSTDYSDFRTIDGIVVAFREDTYASGVHTATSTVQHVVLNPQVAELLLPGEDAGR